MKTRGKKWAAMLLAAVMTLSLLPVGAFATEGAATVENLALNRPTYVSGLTVAKETAEADTVDEQPVTCLRNGSMAVDGTIANISRWKSNTIKNGNTMNAVNSHAWLVVDLGEDVESLSEIKVHFHFKTRATDYVLQVATDAYTPTDYSSNVGEADVTGEAFTGKNAKGDPDTAYWTTIATATGKTWSNTDADKAAPCDTYAATDLTNLPSKIRYLRIYVTGMWHEAGENGTSIQELEVMGTRTAPEPIEGAWNLAEWQPVESSGCSNSTTERGAADGDHDTQWNSQDIKDFTIANNSRDNEEQAHPQWFQIDLGASGSKLSEIHIHYVPNNKVWAMDYEIKTADDPAGPWRTLVSVSRPSANKTFQELDPATDGCLSIVTNEGDIHADVITRTSSPKLNGSVEVGRYVRIFFNKTNAQAPAGHNVNIREIEIFGVNENRHPPVDLAEVLAGVTASTVTVSGSSVGLPDPPAGATLAVRGSTLKNVVAVDGAIGGKNIVSKEVTLLIRAADSTNDQEKNVTVTVPANRSGYPAAWFASTGSNPKPEVIPAIQEWQGYTGDFTLTKSSRIVIDDAANVGLQKVAQNMKADLKEISGLDLTIATGSAPSAGNIYIRSLPTDDYDLGSEGYVMRVSDGIEIYAPTYTGCIFGTVTVEQILWQAADHLTVPQGIARDYPAYEVRGVKLDVGRAPTRYQQLQDVAKIMLWYKISEFDLHINDTENPNASNATDVVNNIGFHRLESDTFPSLKDMPGVKKAGVNPDLVDAAYYNDPDGYGGNPVYTKQQWKDLTQLCKDYGMRLLTEIDMPGHALAYNQYVEQYLEEATEKAGITGPIRSTDTSNFRSIELLDLTGANSANALNFAKALWNEYTSDGTITGNVVHIGADEYWLDSTEVRNAFANFADELRKVIQANLGKDTKIRMWGEGTSKFSTATTALGKTHAELARDYELEIWSTGYDNPVQRSRDGYKLINCEQSAMYSCPGRYGRDVPNAEYLFNSWDPTVFGGSQLLYGDPNLLGAKAVMWGEQTQEGLTERDVNQRILRAVAIMSEKTWTGKQQSEGTFSDYEMRFNRLAEGPGTEIAMNVPSETSLVLDYDFKNISANGKTVFDASGNGYNGTLNAAGTVEDGWLAFDGATLLTTDLTTLSYPYTVSFDLKAAAGNTAASSLFSGYDGRIQVAGHDGHMSANACSFIRDFNYTVPTNGTAVNITIVGTQQATRLYVNGQLVTFLSQTEDKDGVAAGAITSYFSSVPLPLEKIGKGFHGAMANLKVYNKAMSAAEVAAVYAGTDDGLVNVAQDAVVGGSSYHTGDGYDNGVQRTAVAQKAVDGEEEEMYSFWQADHSDSALTVDLGQTRAVSKVEARWNGAAPTFTLQTSADGKAWTAFTNGAAVDARYVRLTTAGAGKLQELLVYERVNKSALDEALTAVEETVTADGLGFESTGAKKTLFDAVVFARAVSESPLATVADVTEAEARLEAAKAKYETPGTTTPGGSTTPSGGSSGGGSGSETLEDEKREDGATVTVAFNPDGSVTETVEQTDGTKSETVTARSGDKTITVTDPEGEEIAKVEVPAVIPAPKAEFEDVDQTPWAKEAINNMAALGLVNGVGGGLYDTSSPVTRGALATMLHRLSNGKTDYRVTFADVRANKYYTQGVAWAAKAKVVNGYTADIFAPDDIITREQLAVMMVRYAKLIGMDTKAEAKSLEAFSDSDNTGAWAVDSVAWCVEHGILKGKGQNDLDPTANVSRAEVAVMLDRFISLIQK